MVNVCPQRSGRSCPTDLLARWHDLSHQKPPLVEYFSIAQRILQIKRSLIERWHGPLLYVDGGYYTGLSFAILVSAKAAGKRGKNADYFLQEEDAAER
jgi:hypothetical protein